MLPHVLNNLQRIIIPNEMAFHDETRQTRISHSIISYNDVSASYTLLSTHPKMWFDNYDILFNVTRLTAKTITIMYGHNAWERNT